MTVIFRGRPACECLAEWLPYYEAELKARGLIKVSIDIYQLIGDAKASAGIHREGGCYDIAQTSDAHVFVARQMGAAAFGRTGPSWDDEHQHGVLRGCPHNGPARYQIAALDLGYNGLGSNGRGGRDTNSRPNPWVRRTWREGIAWHKRQVRIRKLRERRQQITDTIKRLIAKG